MPISRNKRKARNGLGLAPEAHRSNAWKILRRLHQRTAPRTCKDAIRDLSLATRAKDEADDGGDFELSRVANDAMKDIKKSISRSCRERDTSSFELEGLSRAEMMNTRGFKDGRKSWIDVMPAGGPKMRVTHEILEGLGAITHEERKARRRLRAARAREKKPPKIDKRHPSPGFVVRDLLSDKELQAAYKRVRAATRNAEALRKYLEDRRFGLGETSAPRSQSELERIYREVQKALKSEKELVAYLESKQTDPTQFRRRFLEGFEAAKKYRKPDTRIPKRRQRQLDRASAAIYKRLEREWNEGPSWAEKEPPKFDPNLNGFEGVGSSFALMWAAAGAVALFVLSDAQKAGAAQLPVIADPAAQIILQDLNRARAAQGLPPLTR